MNLSRLIESASELQQLAQSARQIEADAETARVSLSTASDDITESEWREITGNYARATADLARIQHRARVLRGRIHFDAEVM